jgi:hypothetical protein
MVARIAQHRAVRAEHQRRLLLGDVEAVEQQAGVLIDQRVEGLVG